MQTLTETPETQKMATVQVGADVLPNCRCVSAQRTETTAFAPNLSEGVTQHRNPFGRPYDGGEVVAMAKEKARLAQVEVSWLGLKGVWVADRAQIEAAWEMYVELVTRITVAPLAANEGLLREALTSMYSLFAENPTDTESARSRRRQIRK